MHAWIEPMFQVATTILLSQILYCTSKTNWWPRNYIIGYRQLKWGLRGLVCVYDVGRGSPESVVLQRHNADTHTCASSQWKTLFLYQMIIKKLHLWFAVTRVRKNNTRAYDNFQNGHGTAFKEEPHHLIINGLLINQNCRVQCSCSPTVPIIILCSYMPTTNPPYNDTPIKP